ncbi:MAG: zinc-dependent alcohol dehydrogenase family protein [Pseudomonadales bacterium]
MRAMVLDRPGGTLRLQDVARPEPGPDQLLVRVRACGVCRTDLHVVDGDIRDGRYPVIPGHQIVGVVERSIPGSPLRVGQRVGIPWLGHTCGSCDFCLHGQENLCDEAAFTGYQLPGGYAEYVAAEARFCFPLPDGYPDIQVAPLLCAGLIGYRALRIALAATEPCRRLGFYGFGNAAHILTQIAVWQGREVYAFTRPDDTGGQRFARELGACWAGGTGTRAPELLDAAIVFAPAGELVPLALTHLRKGGAVVCAGIHMSDIPSFPYVDLWGERSIRSVANLTREDGYALLELAPQVPVRTEVETFPLARTGAALDALRAGRIRGAAVVTID